MPDPLFSGANHICIATNDLDRAVRNWWDRYGVGPWRVYRYDPSTVAAEVDGEAAEFSMRAALAQLGPHFRIEIIEPLEGPNPYTPSLERHGGRDHIHHVRLDVREFEAAVGHLQTLGLRRVMDARFSGGTDDSPRLVGKYFDASDDLGFVLEVASVPREFVMADAEYVYPELMPSTTDRSSVLDGRPGSDS